MQPILFQLGTISIRTYTLLSVAAMFAAMIPVVLEGRRYGWKSSDSKWLVVNCTIIGFIGSHLMYALTRLDVITSASFMSWIKLLLSFHIGYVWYGGFILVCGYLYFYAKNGGIPLRHMFDVGPFAAIAAQIVGRWGCIFEGCCYGSPTTLPWGVVTNTAEHGLVSVHPVPIYESLYLIFVFTILWKIRKRTAYGGQIAVGYLILQPIGRFALEYLRGDSVRGFVLSSGFSTSQMIAAALFVTGVALHFVLRRENRAEHV